MAKLYMIAYFVPTSAMNTVAAKSCEQQGLVPIDPNSDEPEYSTTNKKEAKDRLAHMQRLYPNVIYKLVKVTNG